MNSLILNYLNRLSSVCDAVISLYSYAVKLSCAMVSYIVFNLITFMDCINLSSNYKFSRIDLHGQSHIVHVIN